MNSRATLFVIGHPDRGDDGAAEAALARVPRTALASVDVVRAQHLDVEALMSVGPIVVADAIRGPEPGTIVVWTLSEVAALPAAPTASTHGLPLPAVLTIQSGINQLRYATLKGIMAAKKKEIRAVATSAPAAARQRIVSIYVPEKSKKTQMIGGSPSEAAAELVKRLRNEARVI